jgi:hypothetical protein
MRHSLWPLALAAMMITAVADAREANAQETGDLLVARVGEALIPPREYGHSDGPVDPARHEPIESGKIYDIAYAGIVKGRMRFERRGYSIADLVNPAFSQFEDAPRAARRVVISDIVLTIVDAGPDRLRYRWAYLKGGGDPVFDPSVTDENPGIAVSVKER